MAITKEPGKLGMPWRHTAAMLFVILIASGWASSALAGYKQTFVALMNENYGRICHLKLEGWGGRTLRVDWTAETVKLHILRVMAEIGEAKEELYGDGVRYLKFPNDVGGYNVVDWQTGEKKSVDERAPYYFPD